MKTNSPASNPSEVFTPLNETRSMRLTFPLSSVTVMSGSLNMRGRGTKAVVKIKGNFYKVVGISCGLPRCMCDAKIIPISN